MAGCWYSFIVFLAATLITPGKSKGNKCSEESTSVKSLARANNYLALSILSQTPSNKNVLFSPLGRKSVKSLARANNYLALGILSQLPSNKNVFFSPLSLSTTFGMLYFGTEGETAQELRNTLGYEKAGLPKELVHQTFQKYLTNLPSKDSSAYVLNSANSILLKKDFEVKSSYVREVQDLYQATVKDVDFVKENKKVVQEVNKWVKHKTNGKIEKLLDELDPSTILVLLNAVYFKGTWKIPFDKSETSPQTFYNKGLESGAKQVPMMRRKEKFPYTFFDDAHAFEIPYKGKKISMFFLLPNKTSGLESLEKSLTLEKIRKIRRKMSIKEFQLVLPKFKIEYDREMARDFKSLGADSIFKPGADFSGMTSSSNVYVSQVLHKAVIEVNEEGSKAAAVTGTMTGRMLSSTLSNDLIADHPFLFAIVDRRNGMLLFVGRVTEL